MEKKKLRTKPPCFTNNKKNKVKQKLERHIFRCATLGGLMFACGVSSRAMSSEISMETIHDGILYS